MLKNKINLVKLFRMTNTEVAHPPNLIQSITKTVTFHGCHQRT